MSVNIQLGSTDERLARLETHIEQLRESQDDLHKELAEMSAMLTRYRGFIGGIGFVIGGIPILWVLFKDYIKAHFK